jgi:hypothetical protein
LGYSKFVVGVHTNNGKVWGTRVASKMVDEGEEADFFYPLLKE